MQKGHLLQFNCQGCSQPISFSIFELERNNAPIACPNCNKKYALNDETLRRQLKKFYALCLQIQESEEILSNTSIGIDVGDRSIKVPYKLLLTRLSSILDLMIGNEPVSISFRIEPQTDIPKVRK